MGDIILPPIKKEDVRSAVWDSLEATPPSGSYGERFIGNLDAAVSTRSAHAPADVRSELETVLGLTSARVANLDNLDATISSRSSHIPADIWAVATRELTKYEVAYILGEWLGRWEYTPYIEVSRVSSTLATYYLYLPGSVHRWLIPRDELGLTKLILLTNAYLYVPTGGGESTLIARTGVGDVTLYSHTTAGVGVYPSLRNDISTILGQTYFQFVANLAGDDTTAAKARIYAAMLIGVKE